MRIIKEADNSTNFGMVDPLEDGSCNCSTCNSACNQHCDVNSGKDDTGSGGSCNVKLITYLTMGLIKS